MIIIPIRTETEIRSVPHVNILLIGANCLVYMLFNQGLLGEAGRAFEQRHLVFSSTEPAFHQFFTYQFLHADFWHLFGNMLFLWVFGNSVNAKMGDLPYLLFYLSGGVFAAWGYAAVHPGHFHLVGASGAIAAVTTAYLALYPRSRVILLFWFFFIHFFNLPAMIVIGLKIIAWDNIVAPLVGQTGQVAHQAHLAGYLFGFAAALAMLFIKALPRDQFDILALWKRWHQRREFAAAMADPAAAARARFGAAARVPAGHPGQRNVDERRWDEVTDLRTHIGELLEQGHAAEAAREYEKLMTLDPKQCLTEVQQLGVAREFYRTNRFPQAVAAFERFVKTYPRSREFHNVGLLMGIIYARDLHQYALADEHLTKTMEGLRDTGRRAQCLDWLKRVRTMLGRPAPDASG